MKILLVAATQFEIQPFWDRYSFVNSSERNNLFHSKELATIQILVTGPGVINTAFHLGRVLNEQVFNFVINIGIAGAYSRNINIGDVVWVKEEIWDSYAEAGEHIFQDLEVMNLPQWKNETESQFNRYQLKSDLSESIFTDVQIQLLSRLHHVKGLTSPIVHGHNNSLDRIQQKWNPDIESMEGAAFFHACTLAKVSFAEIRAISNYVAPRDPSQWKIELAIQNLNEFVIRLFS